MATVPKGGSIDTTDTMNISLASTNVSVLVVILIQPSELIITTCGLGSTTVKSSPITGNAQSKCMIFTHLSLLTRCSTDYLKCNV